MLWAWIKTRSSIRAEEQFSMNPAERDESVDDEEYREKKIEG